MDGPIANLTIDAREQLCPAPLLMVKKALREAKGGELVEVVVDDQTSRENILGLCMEKRREILRSWVDGKDFYLLFKNAERRETPP